MGNPISNCPNCNKSLNGFLSSDLLTQSKIDFINKFLNASSPGYCTSCSKPLLAQIAKSLTKQKGDIEKRLEQIIHYIPILSSPAPVNWSYEVVGMVTSQTTSGTGWATELSRQFNDFFGSTSRATNRKIIIATNLCMADLRVQCVRNGGNAIISADIDYSEIGSVTSNMLMICMAGTAIRVTDMSNFSAKNRDTIFEITELTEQLEAITNAQSN